MYHVAIVEDEDDYARQLEQYLERFAQESGNTFAITRFSDGDEIVERYQADYDLILLDIQMQFMDGMTAAEEIRKVDQEVVIIFITNMAQYAIRGYAVDAMDYVLKPVSYFAFSQRIKRALSRMKKRDKRYMTIVIKGGTQKLELEQIAYIESRGHNLVFHTGDAVYQSSGTMAEYEEKLKDAGFFRCGKSYLVNLSQVDGVRDGCALVQGEELPISRSRKTEFMEALADYMGGVMK